MVDEDRKAKKAAIIGMFEGFPGSRSSVGPDVVDAYTRAVEPYSVEAVALACRRFFAGEVPEQNLAFAPSGPEFLRQVRLFTVALGVARRQGSSQGRLVAYPIGEQPPAPLVALGPLEVDYGYGRINMRGMTSAEKELVASSPDLQRLLAGAADPEKLLRNQSLLLTGQRADTHDIHDMVRSIGAAKRTNEVKE